MPRLDGTGPNRQGAMTGKGMGNCANVAHEKNQQYFGGRKFGCEKSCSRGLNRGFGNRNRNFQKLQNRES